MGDYMREIKEFHEPGGYFAPRKKKVMTNFEKWKQELKPEFFIKNDTAFSDKDCISCSSDFECPAMKGCIDGDGLSCAETFLKWAEGSAQE